MLARRTPGPPRVTLNWCSAGITLVSMSLLLHPMGGLLTFVWMFSKSRQRSTSRLHLTTTTSEETLVPNVKNLGNQALIQAIQDLDGIKSLRGALPNGPVKDLYMELEGERNVRKSKASTKVWELRMELQHAENEVRVLKGLKPQPVTGRDGD